MKQGLYFLFFSSLFTACLLQAPTFVVTTTADAGAGSLRQAIVDANANPGSVIAFNIGGGGLQTLQPLSPYPAITAASTIIDGTTQPGFIQSTVPGVVATPFIELDGLLAGPSAIGLSVVADSTLIKSLTINNFSSDGIRIQGSSNGVEGSFIGTNAAGTAAQPNGGNGITIAAPPVPIPALNNAIGGITAGQSNLISGNVGAGIAIVAGPGETVDSTRILGNMIGIDAPRTTPIANRMGIALQNPSAQGLIRRTTIGGVVPAARNIIGGNASDGINLMGATDSTIQGNFIGQFPTIPVIILPNGGFGIQMGQVGTGSANNLVGGTTVAASNIITSNFLGGVGVAGTQTTSNPILINSIFNNGAAGGIQLYAGGNDLQFEPEINLAFRCLALTIGRIMFTAPTLPANALFRIDFYHNDVNRNPITEGQTFIGSIGPVAAGATGSIELPQSVLAGWISATATNLNNGGGPGNTSPFSANSPIEIEAHAVGITQIPAGPLCPGQACVGQAKVLETTITGTPGTTFNLTWSDGLIQEGVGTVSVRTVNPFITTTYSVIAEDLTSQCLGGASTTVVVDDAVGFITLKADPTVICSPTSVVLTATFDSVGPVTLEWSDGFINEGLPSPVSRVVPVDATTTFTVTLFNEAGCSATSNPVTVRVESGLSVSLSANKKCITSGNSALLTAHIRNGVPPFKLVWSDDVKRRRIEERNVTRTVCLRKPTTLSVTVRDAQGCTATSNSVRVALCKRPR